MENVVTERAALNDVRFTKLPWILVVLLAIACGYLYWQVVNTEQLQQQNIKALQTRFENQASLIRELNTKVEKQKSVHPTTINMDDLDARFTALQSRIAAAQSAALSVRIDAAAYRSDLAARVSRLEATSVSANSNNRIDSVEAHLNSIDEQIATLKQLVSQ